MSSSDDDHSPPTVMTSIRTPTMLHHNFKTFCEEQGVTVTTALRNLMEWSLSRHAIPVAGDAIDVVTIRPSDEEMAAAIYELWIWSKGDLKAITYQLGKDYNVSPPFVLHCFGRLLLAGVIKMPDIPSSGS